MCATADLTFPYPASKKLEIEDMVKPFNGYVDLHRGDMRVMIRSFGGECLCEPEPGFEKAFLEFLTTLASKASPVYYCPNDYSQNLKECLILEATPKEIVANHLPSLESKPTRILVRES